MASFNVVNYSLRPSKSIQRSIAFDGARKLQAKLDYRNLLYVGFGSIWFTDFILAHRVLHVPDMISIEADDVGYARANFNRPFKTVSVKKGYSYEILPDLYRAAELHDRPWMMWLDYDKELDESSVEDIRTAVENLPENSLLLTTFNCVGHKYGKPKDRSSRIKALLGDVVPDDKGTDAYQDSVLPGLMADLMLDFMKSAAGGSVRDGGFVPAFRMAYRDQAPMVTVGGVLPSKAERQVVSDIASADDWLGIVPGMIVAPHLTMKEVTVLQAELPTGAAFDKALINQLGFDLDSDQIDAFKEYYRFYPSFAQVVA